MLQHGDTSGVFQLESAGMKSLLKRLRPTVFEAFCTSFPNFCTPGIFFSSSPYKNMALFFSISSFFFLPIAKILPPDINKSYFDFRVEGDAVRFGLGAIKSVGQAAIESFIIEREKNGKYKSIYDPHLDNILLVHQLRNLLLSQSLFLCPLLCLLQLQELYCIPDGLFKSEISKRIYECIVICFY